MKSFVCTSNTDLRDFTDCTYPQASFCFARLLRDRDIKINGVRASKNVALRQGDRVIYYTTPKEEAMPTHLEVFSGSSAYIADKYSGVSAEGLCSELNFCGRFLPVHRLDRNTSGLIVFARDDAAEEELKRLFRERKITKTYLAVCKNGFASPSGVLKDYLVKDGGSAQVKIVRTPQKGAVTAVTEYTVLRQKGGLALVKIILHTGRTHQIRAHLAFYGCPVLGDGKYGDGELNKQHSAARQQLVSHTLAFPKDCAIAELAGREFVSSFTPNI